MCETFSEFLKDKCRLSAGQIYFFIAWVEKFYRFVFENSPSSMDNLESFFPCWPHRIFVARYIPHDTFVVALDDAALSTLQVLFLIFPFYLLLSPS